MLMHALAASCEELRARTGNPPLADPINSKFTDYHENKITVLYRDRNAVAVDCKFDIKEVNSRQLDVFCYARRAGKARVNVDLGKWYQVEGKQDITVK